MRIQRYSVALIAILIAFGQCQIDTDFRNRLYGARPGVDMAAWGRYAQIPHRYSYRFALDNIPQIDILNKGNEVLGVTLTNGQFAAFGPGVIAFHPYKDCASLAFATSIEGLQFDKVINAQDGLIKLNGHIGYANGGLATIRSTFAYTYILIPQQFTEQIIPICKKKFFKKKCHNEVIRHPRGLNHDEVNLLIQGSIYMTLEAAGMAFNGFNLQESPISDNTLENRETIASFKSIKGVAHYNIINAIDASIGTGFSDANTALLEEKVDFNEFTVNLNNSSGKHRIIIAKQESGEYDIKILTK